MVDGVLSIINVFTPSIQNYAIKNCSQLPSTLTRKDGQQFMGTLISMFTLPSDTEVGLPAHSVDFTFCYIFDLNLEIFILQHFSSSLPNVAMIYLNCSTCKKKLVLQIFILQWRLESIFIFVFKLKLAFLNLPENHRGYVVVCLSPRSQGLNELLHSPCAENL